MSDELLAQERARPTDPPPTLAAPPTEHRRRPKPHLVIIGLEIVAALVAGILLAAGLLLWRIGHGALEVTSLTPLIERALNRADAPLRIDIGTTALTWGGGRGSIGVLARDVALRPATSPHDGPALATMPDLFVSFSLPALLTGDLAPSHIDIEGAHLTLARSPTGTLSLAGRPLDQLFAPAVAASPAVPPGWSLEQLLVPASQRGPLAYLSTVAASNVTVDLDDQETDHTARMRLDDLLIYRGDRGVSASARLTADMADRHLAFEARAGYGAATHLLEASLLLDHLDLSGLPRWTSFAQVVGLHSEISGTIAAAIDLRTGSPGPLRLDLTGGAGRADFPIFVGGSLPLAGFHAKLAFDPARQRLTASEVTAEIGSVPGPRGKVDVRPGPKLRLGFVIDGMDPRQLQLPVSLWAADAPAPAQSQPARWRISGDGAVDGLAFDRLGAYWPPDAAPDIRNWVVPNITAGMVDGLTAHYRLTLDPANPDAVVLDQVTGSYKFRGLTARYFDPLPPATGIDGDATFDQNRMDLVATSGKVRTIDVTGAKVALMNFQTSMQTINIDVGLNSGVRDQLKLVDMKPLGFLKRLDQSPASYGGTADTRLTLAFPLTKRLKTDDIDIKAVAELHRLSVVKAALDRDLAAGEARLTVDNRHLALEGSARLAGVPASVDWVQNFSAQAPFESRYQVKTRVDAAQRRNLGIELAADRLQGVVGVDLTYLEWHGGASQLKADLDLRDAILALGEARWAKPQGLPGTARITADLRNGKLTALSALALDAPGLSLAGSLAMASDGKSIARGHLDRLMLGSTLLSATISPRPGGGWRVSAVGPTLDASPLLGEDERESVEKTKAAEKPAARQPLSVALETDRLILGRRREMRNVALDLLIDADGIERLRAQGRVEVAGKPPAGSGKLSAVTASAQVRLQLGDAANGHHFNIETSNLGTTLNGLDVSDHVRGGRATLVGQLREVNGRRHWVGTAYSSPFTIVGAGTLARLLSLASLSGIANLLSGEGIPFNRLETDFDFAENQIAISNGRAYGGAIGINLSGAIDRVKDRLDISGTLVPAYTLNSSLGSIPIVGPLLLGGEGEGLFGANFRLSGPTDEPHITVNPLSVFAPGFLRGLFIFNAPGSALQPPAPE